MIRREFRFYICLLMAFALAVYGAYTPPPGEITQTIIVVVAMFLIIGAVAVGVDIVAIIKAVGEVVSQVRALKVAGLNNQKADENNNTTT